MKSSYWSYSRFGTGLVIFQALLISFLCLVLSQVGFSQNIVKAEYFFNADPGAGNGFPLTITPNDTATFTGTLVSAGLTPGFHRVAIRVKDNLGRWGLPEARIFYVFKNTPKATAIVKAEYYFDTDPGVGNATNLVISPDDTITLTKLMPASTLSNGWHTVGFRTKDNLGKWSAKEVRNFFVGPCASPVPSNAFGWWSTDDATSADPGIPDLAGNQPGVIVNSFPRPFNGIFDGIDDYIGMPDNPAWAFGYQNFSLELLASFATVGGTSADPQDKIIGQSEGFGTAKKWTFSYWNNKLVLTVANGSAYTVDFGSNFSPVANQWYHLALTRSGDTLRMYADGVKIGQQVVPGLNMPDVNAPVTIGYVEWLHISNEQGYFAGSLDEITLYNRTLTQSEIASIAAAGRSGKCKVLSITTAQVPDGQYGHPYSFNFSASFGQEPYKWTLVSGSLPGGITLDSTGALNGLPKEAGNFEYVVKVTDQLGNMSQKSLGINVLMSQSFSQLRIFKSGTSPVPGRNIDYFILLENIGNRNLDSSFVFEHIEPYFRFLGASQGFRTEIKLPDIFTPSDTTDSIPGIISWTNPIGPDQSKIMTYKVALHPEFPLGKSVIGRACGDIRAGEVVACLGVGLAIELSIASGLSALACAGTAGIGCPLAIYILATTLAGAVELECLNEQDHDGNRPNTDTTGQGGPGGGGGGAGCSTCTTTSTAPIDPNEKLVLAPKYIKPDQLLVYPVHYENIGTIEALDVFIRDTLSPHMDLKTFKFISNTGTSLDTTKRIAKFDLIGTNLQPDSSGYVLYSVKPKAGLPNGTIIRNRAGIKFEVFQTYMTNETINIIDGLPPKSSMKPLPDTLYQTAIPLRWSGTDSVGELKDYTIFVSVDGGSYTPLLRNTTDTSAWYLGQPGKTYRFICVAEDVAGNFEVQGPVAEATTYLKVLCTNKYFRDGDGDGYGSKVVYNFSCTQPTGFISDSLDCDDSRPEVHPGGTEVCSLYDENCNGQNNENNVCVVGVTPQVASEKAGELLLIPNPASHQLTISISGNPESDWVFGIFDPEGREVITQTMGAQHSGKDVTIKTDRFRNGIYFIKAISGKRSQVKKLVILH